MPSLLHDVTLFTKNPPNALPNWVRQFHEDEAVWAELQRRRALRAALSALPERLRALAGTEEVSEAQDWLEAGREVGRTVEARGYWAGMRENHDGRTKHTEGAEMELNQISEIIVSAAFHVHRALGPGLLESVYEVILADALRARGLTVERQKPITIRFEGKTFDEGFRADLVVEGQVIVELKSVEQLARVHKKQVLTYLKLSGIKLGLLINFGGELLKGNIERLVVGEVPDLKQSRTESTEDTDLK